MPAYVIAMMSIHDPETYKKYTDLTPPIVKKHGGKFLTRGEKVTTIEGEEYTARMVILEFPSEDHVRAWFADPDYIKGKSLAACSVQGSHSCPARRAEYGKS